MAVAAAVPPEQHHPGPRGGPGIPPVAGTTWDRFAYLVLAVVVVLLAVGQAANARWNGDFWLHAAAVDEWRDHWWDPGNPTQPTDSANPDMTPYTWLVGRVARSTGVDAVTALGWFAVVNAALLVAVLRPVVIRLTGNGRAPSWALLFTLTLWGADSWVWSGYFGLRSLGLVLPYPSAFATAAGLASWLALWRGIEEDPSSGWRSARWWVLLAACLWLVLLTHPITSAWTVIGLSAIAGSRRVDLGRFGLMTLVASGMGALSAALLWLPFPVTALVGKTGTYDLSHEEMYTDLLGRAWPLLAALPALGWRLWRDRDDALGWMAVLGGGVFALGGLTGTWTVGRVFPFLALVGHTALADVVGRSTVVPRDDLPRALARVAVWLVVAAMVVIGFRNGEEGIERALPESVSGHDDATVGIRPQDRFAFLVDHVPDDAAVMASGSARVVLPALSGRAVHAGWEEHLDPEEPDRKDAVARFFSSGVPDAERQQLVDRWAVTHVLLDRFEPSGSEVAAWAATVGAEPIYEDDGYVLFALR